MRSKTGKRIAFFAIAFIVAASVCVASVLSTPKAYARDTWGMRTQMEDALKRFEDKIGDGNIYANIVDGQYNLSQAYERYMTLSRAYDRYILGDNTTALSSTSIQSYITNLDNSTNSLTVWNPKTVTGNNMADGDRMWQGSDGQDDRTWGETKDGKGPIKNEFKNLLWLEKSYNHDSYGRGDANHDSDKSTIFELTYPIQVLVYDGVTTPTFPVLVGARGTGSQRSHRYFYGAVVNNSNLSITRNWTTGQGTGGTYLQTRDYTWNYYDGGTQLTTSSTSNTGTSSHYNNENIWESNRLGNSYAATYINYVRPANSNDYVEHLYPSFTFYAGSNEVPNNNGTAWNNDITGTINGNAYLYVINYKALIDTVRGNGVKDCLKNVANYDEGGLTSLFTALETAMNYDYNGKVTASGTNEATLVSTLDSQVGAIGNSIKSAVDGINNAVSGKNADGYDTLRNAIKDTMDTYDAKNDDVHYCPDKWTAFSTAFEDAEDTIFNAAYPTANYTDHDGAVVKANALTTAYHDLTEHKLSADTQNCYNQYQIDHDVKWLNQANEAHEGMPEGEPVKATCESDGSCTWVWMCENCGSSIDSLTQTVTIPKLDHSSSMKEIAASTGALCNAYDHPAYYQCNITLNPDGLNSATYKEPCHKYFKTADGTGDGYETDAEILAEIQTPGTVHAVVHQSAEPATCTTPGKKDRYECGLCHKYFESDAPGAAEIPSSEIETKIDENAHHFPLTPHAAELSSNCEEPGTMAYYTCDSCGKEFYDSLAQRPVANHDDLKTENSHDLTDIPAKTPNCVDTGNNLYYQCSKCSKYFKDRDAETETSVVAETLAVDGTNHKSPLESTDAKSADCRTMTDGNKAYVHCPDCGKYYAATDVGFENPQTDASSFTIKASHTIDPVADKTALKPATCVADGNKEYYTCSVCDKKFFDATAENPATDETIKIESTGKEHPTTPLPHSDGKAKTCTEAGELPHYYCTTCGKNFSDDAGTIPMDNIEIPASHGDYTLHAQVLATCVSAGNIQYYECNDCHKYFNDSSLTDEIADKNVTIPIDTTSAGHHNTASRSTVVSRARAATCTTDGIIGYQCTQCSKRFRNASATVELTGDDYRVPKQHVLTEVTGTPATCLASGTETCWQCTREGEGSCGKKYYSTNDIYTDETGFDAPKVIDATGHDFTAVPEKAPNCVDSGTEAYFTCNNCKKMFKSDSDKMSEDYLSAPVTEAPVPGNHKNLVKTEYNEPTCQAVGNKEYWYCDACGKYYLTQDDAKADTNQKVYATDIELPKAHNIREVPAVTPTCVDGGNMKYWKCNTCKTCFNNSDGKDEHIIVESTMQLGIDPTNHTDLKPVDKVEASCTVDGKEAHYYCSGCKKQFSDDKGLTPASDEELKIEAHHSITIYHAKQPATCVKTGIDVHYECDKCHELFSNKNESSLIKDKGILTLAIDENNHVNIVSVPAVAPDCKTEKDGVKAHYQCNDCKDLFTDDAGKSPTTLAALRDPYKHSVTPVELQPATCQKVGYEAHFKCTVCEKLFTDEDATTPTTLKELEIAKTDHTRGEFKTVIDKEATCTEKGKQHDEVYCAVCGEKFITNENAKDIDMIPHTRGEVKTVTDKEATCTEKGKAHDEVYCAVCKNKYIDSENERELPMTGHNGPRKTITVEAATCYSEGKEYDANICDACGTEYNKSAERTVAKLAHPSGTKVTRTKKAATCQETGIEYDALVCVICGEEYDVSPDRETPKIYHRTGSIKRVVEKEATCTQTGAYYDEYTCSMCGEVYGKSATVTQPMLPHTQGKVEKTVIKDSTCTAKGQQENKLFCKVCGQNYSSYTTEIDLKPHTPGDPVITEYVAATATRTGSYLKTVTCKVCGTVLSSKRVAIPKTGSGSSTGDPDEVKLEIIDSATDATYVKYSGTGADIQCTGPLAKFVCVTVDGKLVDESDYDLYDGSTLVSFHSDYLDGLKAGNREVVLIYSYGSVTTNLKVIDPNSTGGDDDKPVTPVNPSGKDQYVDNGDGTVTYPGADGKFGTDDDVKVFVGEDGKPGTADDRIIDKGKDGLYGTADDHYTDPADSKDVYPGLDGKFGTADDRKDQGDKTNTDLKGGDRKTNGADGIPGTADDKPVAGGNTANGGSATSPDTGIKVAIPAFISVAFVGAYIIYGSKKRKNEED